jgi:hypothetical protein
MACCGQRRQQINRTVPIQRPNNPAPPANVNRAAGSSRTIIFQYVGKTALTAVGPTSDGIIASVILERSWRLIRGIGRRLHWSRTCGSFS